jgi:hypothetical protein
MLVAECCPSFPEPHSAWRAFSEGDYSLAGAGARPQDKTTLRFAQASARIGHVHVSPSQLAAEVLGDDVSGSVLEFYGVAGRAIRSPG